MNLDKDINISTKIDDKWRTLVSFKQGDKGVQMSFSPEFKTVMVDWLKNPDAGWLNFPVFENERQQQSSHDKAKSNGYQSDELDDEVPF